MLRRSVKNPKRYNLGEEIEYTLSVMLGLSASFGRRSVFIPISLGFSSEIAV